ncbi:hypothetical protein J1614_006132 [Plenodomus biglobosus]|nr:hypothetical protein J1614_006132 [Plenodomus biglobosus]
MTRDSTAIFLRANNSRKWSKRALLPGIILKRIAIPQINGVWSAGSAPREPMPSLPLKLQRDAMVE